MNKAEGMNVGSGAVSETAEKLSCKLWHEKPVGKFCLGFFVFVVAEVIVYITLHWIFPLI